MLRSQSVRRSAYPLLLTLCLTAPAWADPLITNSTSMEVEFLFFSLKKTRSLKCTFSTVMQADWKGGRLSTSRDSEEFVLHFDNIDTKGKRAQLIGNLGAGEVTVMLTPSGLTFVEMTPSGSLNFTTVFPIYKNGSQDFLAVSSRHLLVMDSLFLSQHHGSCKPWG